MSEKTETGKQNASCVHVDVFIIYKLYFIVKVVILLNIKAIFYFC